MTITDKDRDVASRAILKLLNEAHADNLLRCVTEGHIRTKGELMAVAFSGEGLANGARLLLNLRTLLNTFPRDTRLFE